MWREGERFRRTREGDFSDPLSASPTSDSTHINIGKISLGRLSLLGTRDRSRHRSDSFTASIPITTCLSSRSQESQQSPTAATTAAQLKRRPLTQGSVVPPPNTIKHSIIKFFGKLFTFKLTFRSISSKSFCSFN
ncbi:hypothetical protein PPTG_24362 [Phytophthora nicotianae INRA-310]|uniref:Uncharacterized protein n=1 Tax=Phytophthora nicotianae (strain INRA-310) TaxID=761204 RepID=W2PIQ0_PHYN3|nr:hypothetical protein PPTG_24362 [Phytophthora nicotianae INRA-310]ETM99894.1 hypothetical protein PPTG_24362 [Phytophthora nicotianae INRA-310]